MNPNNKIQLFMLHFSGGNCYSFNFLKSLVADSFEFLPLELPGRGKRQHEKFLLTEAAAIQDYVSQITLLRNKNPYLIFGHSMGASLGLRVAKKLEVLGDQPIQLIVAGNAGPGSGKTEKCRSEMTDKELKDELRILGGVPEEILSNDDLFNFFSPIMRADFRVLESGENLASDFKLKSSITAIMGSSEESADEIENWKRFTSGDFKFYLLSGNHFFIHDHPSELIKIIRNCYDRPLVS